MFEASVPIVPSYYISLLPIPGVWTDIWSWSSHNSTLLSCYPPGDTCGPLQQIRDRRGVQARHLNQGSSWAVLVVNIYMPSNYQGALPCLRFSNGILGQLLKIPMLTIPFISEFITAIIVSNILRETKGKYFPVASFIICVHTDPALVAGQWPNIVKAKWSTRTHV